MQKSIKALPLVACLLVTGALQAQTLYRSVGPDGRVTFSDTPPLTNPARPVDKGATPASSGPSFSYELQQVVNRFPVTYYTGENCAPCASGRNFLSSRGVPYTERTVITADDIAALQRLAGEATLPMLTIGSQHIKGYSDVEWGQFLEAAGYTSRVRAPASYRPPAPTPLVQVLSPTLPAAKPAVTPASPELQVETFNTRPRPAAVQPSAEDANPSGIRF